MFADQSVVLGGLNNEPVGDADTQRPAELKARR